MAGNVSEWVADWHDTTDRTRADKLKALWV